jgi:TolA-binding protein
MEGVAMRLVLLGLLGWFGLAWMTAPALAQIDSREGIALQNQILELRRDVQALREQMRGGSGGSSLSSGRSTASVSSGSNDMTAVLLERVSRLEEEVRTLRGRADEGDNARQRLADDVNKQFGDLNFRLDSAGGTPPRASAAPPSLSPPPASLGASPAAGAPASGPVRRSPELAMQEGSAALARRDYPAAEAAAREVLAVPKTPRANDAQFLLAQALNGKKDLAGAAVAYDDSYQRARTGAHAQDSLLGLANALTGIGEKRAACATLDKLKAEFPTPRADLKDPILSARTKAACH